MRNLKKILALVLAMVMSLSLMATASATESTTAAANNYEVATEVLKGLKVVIGDDGGIRENDPITRAEVATLVYRIHTADVSDAKANLYYELATAAFNDLNTVEWAKGYIGYAHNAEIVKGIGGSKFDPTSNITGYEVLAMALRAIGYGKNGEFEGAQWQINTAAWARREGLLDGITSLDETRLDKAATRSMVFQVLFNAIQHIDQQKNWTANDMYVDSTAEKNTMAARLGLEKITGVVMANEWADLRDGTVMKDGWSVLRVDEKDYDIEYATELEDIGESRLAYIHGSDVLWLADSGLNSTKDNEGAEYEVKDLKGSLTVNDTTEHYVNFSDSTKEYSDWLIRYVVDATSTKTVLSAAQLNWLEKNAVVTKKDAATGTVLEYTRTIKPEEKIYSMDLEIMELIFSTADRWAVNPDHEYVTYWVDGEVYVGTSSLTDQSDIKSWKQFKAEYLDDTKDTKVTEAGNGEWLKIIDNDADGVAEYVLKTEYVLDKVVDSITKNGETTYYYGVDITGKTYKSHTGYEPKLGDIVLYAIIDDTVQMQLADSEKAAFRAVNYKERQATTTDGATKEQSDIANETKLPENLVEVDDNNVEYTLYLDKYGYVRAYDNKTTYALVTEIYPTRGMNQAWVTDRTLTAEVMLEGEKTFKEYNLLNNHYANDYNPFYTEEWWYGGNNTETNRQNWLQTATHSLDWNQINRVSETVFDYGRVNPTDKTTHMNQTKDHAWTNVAKYTLGENGINLYTAAEYNNNGTYPRTDYVQLAVTETVSGKNPLYAIADADYTNETSNPNNHYVRAVDDTLFFVVSRGDGYAKQFTGYANIPTLTEKDNDIHAIYAVASNSRTDADVKNYWTADVIVIEIERFDTAYESVALVYSNDYKISNDVKYLQVLDSAKGYIGIVPNNYDIWRNQFLAYGFYGVRNVEATETDGVYTADIYPINSDFNDYGIYFGRVRSSDEELDRSTYITVDVMGNETLTDRYDVEGTTTIRLAANYGGAWSINAKTNYNEANELIVGTHGSNRVEHGDYVIWVEVPGTSAHTNATVGYIVDLSSKLTNPNHGWTNPSWLVSCNNTVPVSNFSADYSIAKAIAGEQNTPYYIDDLADARAKARADIADLIKDLTDEQKAEIQTVLDKAEADIKAAVNQAELDNAVASVKTAVDGLNTTDPDGKITITFNAADATVKVGEDVVTSVKVDKDTDVKFTVAATDAKYTEISVKVGETELTADENGVYTVTADEAKTVVIVASEKTEVVDPIGDVNITAVLCTRVDNALIPTTNPDGSDEHLVTKTPVAADANNQLTFKAADFTSTKWEFDVVEIAAVDKDGKACEVTKNSDGTWTVTATSNDITLSVVSSFDALNPKANNGNGNVSGDGGTGDSGFIDERAAVRLLSGAVVDGDASVDTDTSTATVVRKGWAYVEVREGYELNEPLFVNCRNVTEGITAREPVKVGNYTRYYFYVETFHATQWKVIFTTRLALETDPTIEFSVVNSDGTTSDKTWSDCINLFYDNNPYTTETKLAKDGVLTYTTKTITDKVVKVAINGDSSGVYKVKADDVVKVVITIADPPEKVTVTFKYHFQNQDDMLSTVKVDGATLANETADTTDTNLKIGSKVVDGGTTLKITADIPAAKATIGYKYVVAEANDDNFTVKSFTKKTGNSFEVELTVGETDVTYNLYSVTDGLTIKKNATEVFTNKPAVTVNTLASGLVEVDAVPNPRYDYTDFTVADLSKVMFVGDNTAITVNGGRTLGLEEVKTDALLRLHAVAATSPDRLDRVYMTSGGKDFTLTFYGDGDNHTINVDGELISAREGETVNVTVKGDYFTINDGTSYGVISSGAIDYSGTAITGSIALTDYVEAAKLGKNGQVAITIGDKNLTIDSGYYKATTTAWTNEVTSTTADEGYYKAGDTVEIAKIGTWLEVTNGETGNKVAYYDASGDELGENDVIALDVSKLAKTTDGTKYTVKMPAHEASIITNLYKVVVDNETPAGVTLNNDIDETGTAFFISGDVELLTLTTAGTALYTFTDGTQSLETSTNAVKIGTSLKKDLTIKFGEFKTVNVKIAEGVTGVNLYSDEDGDIDLSGLKSRLAAVGVAVVDGTYVSINNKADGTGNYQAIGDDGTLEGTSGTTTLDAGAMIPVADLAGLKEVPVGDDGLEIILGYRKVTVDYSAITKAGTADKDLADVTIGTGDGDLGIADDTAITGVTPETEAYVNSRGTITITVAKSSTGRFTLNGKPYVSGGEDITITLSAEQSDIILTLA